MDMEYFNVFSPHWLKNSIMKVEKSQKCEKEMCYNICKVCSMVSDTEYAFMIILEMDFTVTINLAYILC